MKAYTNVMAHIVSLGFVPNESEGQHYDRAIEANRWCDAQFPGKNRFNINMRSGQRPYQFEFKRARDAMLFKLTWG